jgi:AraC family transcriptional activator of pobA
VDAASSLVADRLTAALAARVWAFRSAAKGSCHIFLLTKGHAVLSRPPLDELELRAPVLLWLPQPLDGAVHLRAGAEGYAAFVSDKFVQRTASDPMLLAHRQPFLTRFSLASAEMTAAKLPSLTASFQALVDESHEMAPGAASALSLHLGVLILHLWRSTGLQSVQGRSGQTTVERFTRLIELHYREALRVSDYADRLGVSQAHLHESCLRMARKTPLALVHERLLEEAKARLRQNDMSVEQVGYSLGFRDPGYFNRFFKRLAGQAPGAFQRSTGKRRRQAPSSFAAWP